MRRIFTVEQASEIWDILVQQVGAPDNYERMCFMLHVAEGNWTEYRFPGKLGFGGKVWNNLGRVYVTCYRENETPETLDIIEKTNKLLEKFDE